MNTTRGETYQQVLQRTANQLGLSRSGDLEQSTIDHCLGELRLWIAAHGQPDTMTQLVDRFALLLDVRFKEIRGPADMDGQLNWI